MQRQFSRSQPGSAPDVDPELELDEGLEQPEPSESSTSDDIPDEFFGHDLAGIEDEEARRATYEALKEVDRTANARLREIAELRKELDKEAARARMQPREPEQQRSAADYTDEELMDYIGADPDILRYEELAKPMLKLARNQIQQDQRLDGLSQSNESATWERQFYGELDRLESDFGKIPYDRGTIEDFAVERSIFDPAALYWSIMGPIQREAAQPRTSAQDSAVRDLKRGLRGPRRQAGQQPVETSDKPKNMQEAYEMAKRQLKVPQNVDPFDQE